MPWPKGRPRPRTQPDECRVRRCLERPLARGLCNRHYHEWWMRYAWSKGRRGSIGGNQEWIASTIEKFIIDTKS